MRYPDASKGLSYYLPKRPRKKTVLQIPGAHTLYVGPSSCMRRHAIKAIEDGDRGRASFLYLTEADLISGDYEGAITDAIAELINIVTPEPYIFMITVFCIDDFLGTDEEALIAYLEEEFPDRKFGFNRINPISLNESAKDGAMKGNFNSYSFISPSQQHDEGVNLLGVYTPFDPDCEFLQILNEWGVEPIRTLLTCETYQDYQDLGKSKLSIDLRFASQDTKNFLINTLGMSFLHLPAVYDLHEIIEGYESIAHILKKKNIDLSVYIADTKLAIENARSSLLDTPLNIDSSASMLPFRLSLALLNYGFNVKRIFYSRHLFADDRGAYEAISTRYPDVDIVRGDNIDIFQDKYISKNEVAIGQKAGSILDTERVIDLWHDEGFYGFHGVKKLMNLLIEVSENSTVNSKKGGGI